MTEQTPFELFGPECGEGWKDLYEPIIEASADVGASVFQIKEKFGILRIYLDNAPSWLVDMCDNMECFSQYVCEYCGKEGKLRGGGWIKTLCDDCYKK